MDSSVAQNPVASGAAAGGVAPTGPAIATPRPIDLSGAPRIPKRLSPAPLNAPYNNLVSMKFSATFPLEKSTFFFYPPPNVFKVHYVIYIGFASPPQPIITNVSHST